MREDELFRVLREHGQEHIIEAYEKLDGAGREKLAAQVERIDWSIVDMAKQEETAQERGKLEPLSALEVRSRKTGQSMRRQDWMRSGQAGSALCCLRADRERALVLTDQRASTISV